MKRLRPAGGSEQRSQFRYDFANVEVEEAVFDIVGTHGLLCAGNFQSKRVLERAISSRMARKV